MQCEHEVAGVMIAKGRITAVHRSIRHICQVAPMCTQAFEKTCATTQRKRKKSCFLDFEKKRKNVYVQFQRKLNHSGL